MHLYLLGVSHRTAPVELRERLDFSTRDLGGAVEALAARSSATESVVLSFVMILVWDYFLTSIML